MSDLPDLYKAVPSEERVWAVLYKGKPFAYVIAREDEPDEDASYRAHMLAKVMNATRDMTAPDIRHLLKEYEKANGHRYHADWRSKDEEEVSES